MSYGICMEGNEPAFERAIHTAILATSEDRTYRERVLQVVEVGTASGQTARGIAEFMARELGQVDYALNTYDIPEGWSLNWSAVEQVIKDHPQVRAHVVAGGVQVAMAEHGGWEGPVDFAFIDGCHGAPCATRDFLAIARHSVPGSVVVFHDSSPSCQGIHMQPHCRTPINVRKALSDLGLLTGTFKGWKLLEETNANHGITVVQRTDDSE